MSALAPPMLVLAALTVSDSGAKVNEFAQASEFANGVIDVMDRSAMVVIVLPAWVFSEFV